ncbi:MULTISPECIES: DNA alkylation repair protein [unclassified Arthrobacter]|uniref:DNA alkylation repair protein n=1 Tax=unclassified Arthrobacter TaxID=235627 RepID=UPI001D135CA3|nr:MULTISPECIES: DNA alkylation repair protein [unclassified Arthrobacter]MCC3274497.1 DNA alkylation repair protein [Arthrobacter sp. zg-Y20]MCC9177910.1 DNA alkylation repair protein [Arthrobacter sp. zg-Y750]MDK1314654.1 DNA alkylation repair protein [Arthrobacter sp. zg.Y20]WIB07635.1 DNA alkylation repair protein [Arthrobacter sp. zg-Y20]
MDDMLGPGEVRELHDVLASAVPSVQWEAVLAAGERLEPLSLRGRTDVVADVLVDALGSYPAAASAFRMGLANPAFTGWMLWPVTEAAVTLALRSGEDEDFDDALALLAELTPRLTSEFAIRRLLRERPERALGIIRTWTAHPDQHVRRLASEGTRTYLPWAVRVPQLTARPELTLPILDAMHNDPEIYVRRSVANHTNDLARHAPDLVLETAARWQQTGTPGSTWVVRHALRTLIKKGNPGALELMGFAPAQVSIGDLHAESEKLALPGELAFGFLLTNTGDVPAKLAVDYAVHYVKASGSTAEKVFKLATVELAAGESRKLTGRHAFRQMTTRRHYAGVHALELQVNGVRHGRLEFEVTI